MAALTIDLTLDSDADDIAREVRRWLMREMHVELADAHALAVDVIDLNGPGAGATVVALTGDEAVLVRLAEAYGLDTSDVDRDEE